MAAGLSQSQKSYIARQSLKSIQAQFGGVYRNGKAGCVSSLQLDGGNEVYVKWSNMSNGGSVGVLVAYNAGRNVKVEGKYGEPVSELLARLAAV